MERTAENGCKKQHKTHRYSTKQKCIPTILCYELIDAKMTILKDLYNPTYVLMFQKDKIDNGNSIHIHLSTFKKKLHFKPTFKLKCNKRKLNVIKTNNLSNLIKKLKTKENKTCNLTNSIIRKRLSVECFLENISKTTTKKIRYELINRAFLKRNNSFIEPENYQSVEGLTDWVERKKTDIDMTLLEPTKILAIVVIRSKQKNIYLPTCNELLSNLSINGLKFNDNVIRINGNPFLNGRALKLKLTTIRVYFEKKLFNSDNILQKMEEYKTEIDKLMIEIDESNVKEINDSITKILQKIKRLQNVIDHQDDKTRFNDITENIYKTILACKPESTVEIDEFENALKNFYNSDRFLDKVKNLTMELRKTYQEKEFETCLEKKLQNNKKQKFIQGDDYIKCIRDIQEKLKNNVSNQKNNDTAKEEMRRKNSVHWDKSININDRKLDVNEYKIKKTRSKSCDEKISKHKLIEDKKKTNSPRSKSCEIPRNEKNSLHKKHQDGKKDSKKPSENKKSKNKTPRSKSESNNEKTSHKKYTQKKRSKSEKNSLHETEKKSEDKKWKDILSKKDLNRKKIQNNLQWKELLPKKDAHKKPQDVQHKKESHNKKNSKDSKKSPRNPDKKNQISPRNSTKEIKDKRSTSTMNSRKKDDKTDDRPLKKSKSIPKDLQSPKSKCNLKTENKQTDVVMNKELNSINDAIENMIKIVTNHFEDIGKTSENQKLSTCDDKRIKIIEVVPDAVIEDKSIQTIPVNKISKDNDVKESEEENFENNTDNLEESILLYKIMNHKKLSSADFKKLKQSNVVDKILKNEQLNLEYLKNLEEINQNIINSSAADIKKILGSVPHRDARIEKLMAAANKIQTEISSVVDNNQIVKFLENPQEKLITDANIIKEKISTIVTDKKTNELKDLNESQKQDSDGSSESGLDDISRLETDNTSVDEFVTALEDTTDNDSELNKSDQKGDKKLYAVDVLMSVAKNMKDAYWSIINYPNKSERKTDSGSVESTNVIYEKYPHLSKLTMNNSIPNQSEINMIIEELKSVAFDIKDEILSTSNIVSNNSNNSIITVKETPPSMCLNESHISEDSGVVMDSDSITKIDDLDLPLVKDSIELLSITEDELTEIKQELSMTNPVMFNRYFPDMTNKSSSSFIKSYDLPNVEQNLLKIPSYGSLVRLPSIENNKSETDLKSLDKKVSNSTNFLNSIEKEFSELTKNFIGSLSEAVEENKKIETVKKVSKTCIKKSENKKKPVPVKHNRGKHSTQKSPNPNKRFPIQFVKILKSQKSTTKSKIPNQKTQNSKSRNPTPKQSQKSVPTTKSENPTPKPSQKFNPTPAPSITDKNEVDMINDRSIQNLLKLNETDEDDDEPENSPKEEEISVEKTQSCTDQHEIINVFKTNSLIKIKDFKKQKSLDKRLHKNRGKTKSCKKITQFTNLIKMHSRRNISSQHTFPVITEHKNESLKHPMTAPKEYIRKIYDHSFVEYNLTLEQALEMFKPKRETKEEQKESSAVYEETKTKLDIHITFDDDERSGNVDFTPKEAAMPLKTVESKTLRKIFGTEKSTIETVKADPPPKKKIKVTPGKKKPTALAEVQELLQKTTNIFHNINNKLVKKPGKKNQKKNETEKTVEKVSIESIPPINPVMLFNRPGTFLKSFNNDKKDYDQSSTETEILEVELKKSIDKTLTESALENAVYFTCNLESALEKKSLSSDKQELVNKIKTNLDNFHKKLTNLSKQYMLDVDSKSLDLIDTCTKNEKIILEDENGDKSQLEILKYIDTKDCAVNTKNVVIKNLHNALMIIKKLKEASKAIEGCKQVEPVKIKSKISTTSSKTSKNNKLKKDKPVVESHCIKPKKIETKPLPHIKSRPPSSKSNKSSIHPPKNNSKTQPRVTTLVPSAVTPKTPPHSPPHSRLDQKTEDELAKLTLDSFPPIQSEYPRRDHRIHTSIENTFLYKLVYGDYDQSLMEPHIKCSNGTCTFCGISEVKDDSREPLNCHLGSKKQATCKFDFDKYWKDLQIRYGNYHRTYFTFPLTVEKMQKKPETTRPHNLYLPKFLQQRTPIVKTMKPPDNKIQKNIEHSIMRTVSRANKQIKNRTSNNTTKSSNLKIRKNQCNTQRQQRLEAFFNKNYEKIVKIDLEEKSTKETITKNSKVRVVKSKDNSKMETGKDLQNYIDVVEQKFLKTFSLPETEKVKAYRVLEQEIKNILELITNKNNKDLNTGISKSLDRIQKEVSENDKQAFEDPDLSKNVKMLKEIKRMLSEEETKKSSNDELKKKTQNFPQPTRSKRFLNNLQSLITNKNITDISISPKKSKSLDDNQKIDSITSIELINSEDDYETEIEETATDTSSTIGIYCKYVKVPLRLSTNHVNDTASKSTNQILTYDISQENVKNVNVSSDNEKTISDTTFTGTDLSQSNYSSLSDVLDDININYDNDTVSEKILEFLDIITSFSFDNLIKVEVYFYRSLRYVQPFYIRTIEHQISIYNRIYEPNENLSDSLIKISKNLDNLTSVPRLCRIMSFKDTNLRKYVSVPQFNLPTDPFLFYKTGPRPMNTLTFRKQSDSLCSTMVLNLHVLDHRPTTQSVSTNVRKLKKRRSVRTRKYINVGKKRKLHTIKYVEPNITINNRNYKLVLIPLYLLVFVIVFFSLVLNFVCE